MDASKYPPRYLHIAGAFAVGGTFDNIGGTGMGTSIQTIAPVHLPMVGGISETKVGKTGLDCSKMKAPGLSRDARTKLQSQKLISIGSAYSLAKADPPAQGQPFSSQSISQVSNVRRPVRAGAVHRRAICARRPAH